MALDVVGRRLDAAGKIRDVGFLATISQPTYSGRRKTGDDEVKAWAVQQMSSRSRGRNGSKMAEADYELAIAALVTNEDGTFGDVLVLKQGDLLSLDGKHVEVMDPGAITPARKADGSADPIVYKTKARLVPDVRP